MIELFLLCFLFSSGFGGGGTDRGTDHPFPIYRFPYETFNDLRQRRPAVDYHFYDNVYGDEDVTHMLFEFPLVTTIRDAGMFEHPDYPGTWLVVARLGK